MTASPDEWGFVQDSNRYNAIPVGVPGTYSASNSFQYNRSVSTSSSTLDNNRYTSTVPLKSGPNYWGRNGYFYNGPTFEAMMYGNSEVNQILSYVQEWSDPIKRSYLDNFSGLLLKYGHTNSPGTLWAIAKAGFDPSNDTIQQVLKTDAEAFAEEYAGRAPTAAGSVVSQSQSSQAGDNDFWAPVEFASRNAFSALMMPLEAIQGTLRGAGGELTREGAPWLDFAEGRISGAFAQLGSLFMPPVGLLADRVRGEDFIDPWEQTDFGQTLLAAKNGQGFEAFTKGQAGLDLGRAKDELLQLDPTLAVQPKENLQAMAQQYAKEQGYYSEPGWFVDETSTVGEAQRQATYKAWAIPGPNDQLTAWTLGRGIFSNVGGPDWEGYQVASGLVDAVAAVLMDPTIVGGKLGIPSKLVKVSTRAAGRPVLIGRERTKALQGYKTSVQSLSKAFELAQAGKLDEARRFAYPVLRDAFERPPTQREIDEFLSEPEFFNQATLGLSQIEDIADVVNQAKRGQITAEHMARARADSNQAAGLARDARSARLKASKYNRIVNEGSVDDPAILAAHQEDVARSVGLWDEYIANSFDNNGRFNADSFDNWLNTRFADPSTDDDFLLFQQLGDLFVQARATNPSITRQTFRDALDNDPVDSRVWTAQREINPNKVEQDTARLFFNDENAEAVVKDMVDTQINGIILQGIPSRTAPVLGAYNEAGAVFYAPTGAQLKVVAAGDRVSNSVLTRLRDRTLALIDDPEMRPIESNQRLLNYESVPGQISSKIEQATDIRFAVEDFFYNSPVITYGGLLDAYVRFGLDVALDDLLRDLPKTMRIDGITDIRGISGRTWIGDSGKVLGYQVSDTGKTAGLGAREVPDGDAAFAALTAQMQVPVGIRGQSVSDAAARASAFNEEAAINWNRLEGLRLDNMFKGQQEQIALEQNLARLDAEWASPIDKLRSTIGWQAGLRYGLNGVTLDEKSMRNFIFGSGPFANLANKAFDALSEFIPETKRLDMQAELAAAAGDRTKLSKEFLDYYSDAVGQVRMLSGGRWSSETSRAIVDNAIAGGGKDGLLAALAPRVGLDISQGSASKTIRSMPGDGKTFFRTWRDTNPGVRRIINNLTRGLPAGRVVNLSNSDEIVGTMISYGKAAGLDEADVAKFVGEVSVADGLASQAAVNRNALVGLFDKINEKLVADLSKNADFVQLFRGKKGFARKQELLRQISDSTAVFIGGKYKARRDADEAVATDSAPVQILGNEGEKMDLPSVILETEIANGFVNLPSVDEWRVALNRFTLAMQRYETLGKTWDFAFDVYDNFFRTSLLVFRGAYLLRNAGEMQFRMYLNGHHSIFNSPFTLTGMVIADNRYAKKLNNYNKLFEKTRSDLQKKAGKDVKVTDNQVRAIVGEPPKQSRLLESFNQFSNTVLDTRFNTGLDAELAAANHVDDFFSLIRESNSLVDPRVYKYSGRSGWTPIEYGNRNFAAGWANELIMLERSKIARLVLGNREGSYGAALNGSLDESAQAAVAREFMYSNEFADVREQLIGASSAYRGILDNEAGVIDFLFTNQNSVLNRITKYTNNDADLLEFIRTGRYRDGNDILVPRTFTDPKKKIREFSGALQRKLDADESLRLHMKQSKVTVPWTDFPSDLRKRGTGLADWFFSTTNKIERLSSVGPEFKQAYWDRVAELAPGLRRSDVDTVFKAAEATLSPLKRLVGNKVVGISKNHPAWEALRKAKAENSDGLLTADEIHNLAAKHASEVVSGLFYDASRRNNLWYQLRLLTPFGQAYGNTLKTWGNLGAKKPIKIYEIQKLFNALQEEDSQAIYEAGQRLGLYQNVADGSAPWDQDLDGGFFFSDQNGETTFMVPILGQAASVPIRFWGMVNGVDTTRISTEYKSPAQSMNLAFGGESIVPGMSPLVPWMLNSSLLPDVQVVSQLRQLAAPFGDKDITQSAVPAWLQKSIAGADVVPFIGAPISSALGKALAPGVKGKNVSAAATMLASTGGYQNYYQDPRVQQRFNEDVNELSSLLTLITGVFQNLNPSTPVPNYYATFTPSKGMKPDVTPQQYAIGFISSLYYGAYLPRNGEDGTQASTELISDFGPGALFAIQGNVKGFTRMPKSAALDWAQRNPDLSKAWNNTFELFFPGGDMAQVEAVRWLSRNAFYDQEYKNPDEISDDVINSLERIQRLTIDAKYANGLIDEATHEQMRDELADRYTVAGTNVFTIVDYSAELKKFNEFALLPEVRGSDAAIGFRKVWILRDQALQRVRAATGDPDSGLGSQDAEAVYTQYLADIDNITKEHPDFKLLAGYFKREWR